MWKMFLSKWNGHSLFLVSSPSPAQNLELYTNAVGSIGFGGYFQGKWFHSCWPLHMQLNKQWGIIIEWQHCCLRNMAPLLAVKQLQFCCNNSSAVSSINPGNSKTPHIVDFVRHVMLHSIQHNFTVRAHHITGVSNEIADALSRFQMQCFQALAPDTNQNPCTNPPSLMTL